MWQLKLEQLKLEHQTLRIAIQDIHTHHWRINITMQSTAHAFRHSLKSGTLTLNPKVMHMCYRAYAPLLATVNTISTCVLRLLIHQA